MLPTKYELSSKRLLVLTKQAHRDLPFVAIYTAFEQMKYKTHCSMVCDRTPTQFFSSSANRQSFTPSHKKSFATHTPELKRLIRLQ